jgi:hypothetical protein
VFAAEGPPAVAVATAFPFVRVVEIMTADVDRADDGEAATVTPAVAVAASRMFEVVATPENTLYTPTSV